MLLDSNIIIYSALPQYAVLLSWISKRRCAASSVSLVEVIGFFGIKSADEKTFRLFFANTELFPIGDAILEEAVRLRQQHKLSLGDGIIAATALVHNRPLATRNVSDFKDIAGLRVINPFDEFPAAT